jgi:hypothetical protein
VAVGSALPGHRLDPRQSGNDHGPATVGNGR